MYDKCNNYNNYKNGFENLVKEGVVIRKPLRISMNIKQIIFDK